MIRNIDDGPNYIKEVEAIFFEASSVQSFKSEDEKEKLLHKYLGVYYLNWPELFFVYVFNNKVLGYICGVRDTEAGEILDLQPHLKSFGSEIQQFPAHLHINLTSSARGKNIGRELVNYFCSQLKTKGVHIITSELSRNVSFYKKNDFNFTKIYTTEYGTMLFMGKLLT